ncbi:MULTISPECIES: hydroxyphenylacetyl-CoA thioesterase PaaI [Brevibacillus]|jgi:acyl-CoA thioesterase|uniref:Acyl-CoA thioesterase n=1 Tax=Brevibacillus centrosporus TaxID=54910 RepID=A0A1I4AHG1_9BACL|nr:MULTISPECIES: hydroxyphenylacetyl-CoA thioesterase PaaI [Brevibacillus]MDR7315636.1 acyl-CoA thioesterase [Brevibacillus nitrificans]MEC2128044.1 hydroxyphenylacetyl-CoA thioesterase PaaI [Brevibacillus centrosporus]MED1952905.1 hydroxyphenylacetyl-CoA thioesterase PaaI [Brevibacillus centrosporus]MED4910651.1 hydroxyphenylacetyl-CoA thioesterase PaaI [Brevibacillus centrosporus]RNB67590.1 hydroxyphenylacetyl-CoA thioesterase PaaI [Brevibacillus centrosporus]
MRQTIDESKLHQERYNEICEKLTQDKYAQFLGIRLIELGEGTATAELTVEEHMLNAHGTAHGAVIFSLADFVFAAACNSYGKTSVALSMNIGFLAAGFKGNRLVATATEEKKNNRTAWYRIRVESDSELIATLDALAYRKNDYFVSIEDHEAK